MYAHSSSLRQSYVSLLSIVSPMRTAAISFSHLAMS